MKAIIKITKTSILLFFAFPIFAQDGDNEMVKAMQHIATCLARGEDDCKNKYIIDKQTSITYIPNVDTILTCEELDDVHNSSNLSMIHKPSEMNKNYKGKKYFVVLDSNLLGFVFVYNSVFTSAEGSFKICYRNLSSAKNQKCTNLTDLPSKAFSTSKEEIVLSSKWKDNIDTSLVSIVQEWKGEREHFLFIDYEIQFTDHKHPKKHNIWEIREVWIKDGESSYCTGAVAKPYDQ